MKYVYFCYVNSFIKMGSHRDTAGLGKHQRRDDGRRCAWGGVVDSGLWLKCPQTSGALETSARLDIELLWRGARNSLSMSTVEFTLDSGLEILYVIPVYTAAHKQRRHRQWETFPVLFYRVQPYTVWLAHYGRTPQRSSRWCSPWPAQTWSISLTKHGGKKTLL